MKECKGALCTVGFHAVQEYKSKIIAKLKSKITDLEDTSRSFKRMLMRPPEGLSQKIAAYREAIEMIRGDHIVDPDEKVRMES